MLIRHNNIYNIGIRHSSIRRYIIITVHKRFIYCTFCKKAKKIKTGGVICEKNIGGIF